MFCSYRLIVVLRNQVHVFTFPNNPQKIQTFETRDNPKGNYNGFIRLSVLVFKLLIVKFEMIFTTQLKTVAWCIFTISIPRNKTRKKLDITWCHAGPLWQIFRNAVNLMSSLTHMVNAVKH